MPDKDCVITIITNFLFKISREIQNKMHRRHCVNSVRIRSFSGPDFPAFGLNTEIYRVNLRIQSKCEKMRTRKTPDTDTFHEVPQLI